MTAMISKAIFTVLRSITARRKAKTAPKIERVDAITSSPQLAKSAAAAATLFAISVRPQEYNSPMKKASGQKRCTNPLSAFIARRSVERLIKSTQQQQSRVSRPITSFQRRRRRAQAARTAVTESPQTQTAAQPMHTVLPSPNVVQVSSNRVRFSDQLVKSNSDNRSHRPFGSILRRRSDRVSPVNRQWVENGDKNVEAIGLLEKHFAGRRAVCNDRDRFASACWFDTVPPNQWN